MKVLIVDPSETARDYISRCLPDDWQRDIRFASGFLEASWHAVSTHPDAVVADLLLPDPNGITLVRNLRALNPQAFIVASARNILFAQCCHRAGADFFFRSCDDLSILRNRLVAFESELTARHDDSFLPTGIAMPTPASHPVLRGIAL